uniref:Phosphoinositide phospholipase C n=1 Tax=Panagrellus redivivus TaxID=6233 RepID=A0A7E4UWB1_PANRE
MLPRRQKMSTASAPPGGSLSRHSGGHSVSSLTGSYRGTFSRHNGMDMEKICMAMEKGHKVCKMVLLKKWDPGYKRLSLSRETRQLVLSKWETTPTARASTAKQSLDLRLVKEVHTVDYKMNSMNIEDKWKKDKEIKCLDAEMILVISYGTSFVLSHWIILFEQKDACKLWSQGVHHLMMETQHASHFLQVERWLRKQFFGLLATDATGITMRHMKPFVQTTLQCKVQSRELQEISEGEMDFEAFTLAINRLLNFDGLFDALFAQTIKPVGRRVTLDAFYGFLKDIQQDEIAASREQTAEFLRGYLREVDLARDCTEPYLSCEEFIDYLYSPENSLFDPVNSKVIHDMTQPLTNYWIASSHNTYLTGDQIKSESSLDAYSRALLMGCRCIELDCWDGPKKPNGDWEIVIYHGYTMTSKLNLRDVLYTIRYYAFITSDYPVILSIEDNCSVLAQRTMAKLFKECLGDLLLTTPISKDETQLPSPAALKKKIILKHKKLQLENDNLSLQSFEDEDQDILSKNFVKRGMLHLRNNTEHTWTKHVFVLFPDRLCFVTAPVENDVPPGKEDTVSIIGDEDSQDDSSLSGFGVRPEEMHVTEEWFHGRIDHEAAKQRLLEYASKGNGLFLVRQSGTFIGEFSLSFLHDGRVHHARVKTTMVNGEKRYQFFENKSMETLYELISYYTKHQFTTRQISTTLLTPCPQPQPHLKEPWFSDKADKQRAEELLNTVREDGAFLIRYSSSDSNVFVLSLKVDGEFWHYRLKRDGRIFVVNQTVFENLNQIVEFYSTREFVRGIVLKYPVNEQNVGQYASSQMSSAPGCYMDLKDLDQELDVVALTPYVGVHREDLSFPINAVIKVIRKEPDMWKGRYNNKVGWFPPEYVKELSTPAGNNGEINHSTIELAGTMVEKVDSDKPNAFRISTPSNHWSSEEWIIAAENAEEMSDWLAQMHEITRNATSRIHQLRTREKVLRVAAELSNLVVYCQAVPFNPNFVRENHFYEMCSFSENKLDKLIEKGLLQFNVRHLGRVYPQASRLTSTNFNPMPMWNTGCHMVALNYQTPDKSMQLNQGKFISNGRCGYVLKPQYLLDETFKVDNPLSVTGNFPIELNITVISGRNLSRKDKIKGICSPFVDVEVLGLSFDNDTQRTRTFSSNGLNPVWNEPFVFTILCPEMALIRFYVEDGDFVGNKSDPFIGQAVFPVDSLRGGYRSVPLLNLFSEPLELSSLLVRVEIRPHKIPDQILLNPHSQLQNGRTTLTSSGSGRNLSVVSGSGASFNSSIDLHHSSPHGSPSTRRISGAFPQRTASIESNESQQSNSISKKSSTTLRKLFRMGR